MAYVAPTASDLKARYPAFADVADALVSATLVDAGRHVDDSWTEGDYAPAIMALAAHMLATEGSVSGVVAPAHGNLVSKSMGDASETYAQPSGGDLFQSDYATTPYGRKFLMLQRVNVGGGPVVV